MQDITVNFMSSTGPAGITVNVEDKISGQIIVRFSLTKEQIFDLITGAGGDREGTPAQVVNARGLARLGKQQHVFRRHFRTSGADVRSALRTGTVPAELEEWSQAFEVKCWMDSGRWSLHNDGVRYTAYRYDNELTGEQFEGISKTLANAEPPKGL